MIHLADIRWFQVLLIESGALLLVLAICAYVKDVASHHGLAGHRDLKTNGDEQEEEPENSQQSPESQAHLEHGEAAPTGNNAVHLMRTAKVKFVQSFKFREQDSLHHFGNQ
jgi:hypothetical protein